MGTPARRYKIIDMTIIPSASPERIGKKDVVITYQDEALRVRVVTLPYEDIEGKSEEEQLKVITEAIRAQEAERARFVGREITI